jgi:hypothetical protein
MRSGCVRTKYSNANLLFGFKSGDQCTPISVPSLRRISRLIPRFWGQGFATEGSLAALEFGFCEIHLDTVVAFAAEANTGSRRVMEKVGMVYGSDFDHPSIPELSPLRRHVL